MADVIAKLRSSIHTSLMKSTLFRGSLLGGIGMFLIAFAGTLIPLSQLTIYGLPLYAIGCCLITVGLLPYRRLCILEKNPNELWLTDNRLIYRVKKKQIFSIDLHFILNAEYVDAPYYGITIFLKDPLENVFVYDKAFNKGLKSNFTRKSSAQIFLPYFSKRSLHLLSEHLEEAFA